jgi:hypothetical protein
MAVRGGKQRQHDLNHSECRKWADIGRFRTHIELLLHRLREGAKWARYLEMHGSGEKALLGTVGERVGQEAGGKEFGTPRPGLYQHLDFGIAGRDFVVHGS